MLSENFIHNRENEKQLQAVIVDPRERRDVLEFLYSMPLNENAYEGKGLEKPVEESIHEHLDGYDETENVTLVVEDEGNIYGVAFLSLFGHEKAYLWRSAVDPKFRGKGIAKMLTDKRLQIARERGYKVAQVDISSKNPLSLASKLSQGFTIKRMDIHGGFELEKSLIDDEIEPQGDTIEVPLQAESRIRELLEEGYVGVDIKNTFLNEGEVTISHPSDIDPGHWTLIFTKSPDLQ